MTHSMYVSLLAVESSEIGRNAVVGSVFHARFDDGDQHFDLFRGHSPCSGRVERLTARDGTYIKQYF
jgi:hypothetical protein